MKQLYYVIQTLLHGRNANVIKVISLGLGLMMSILLFSRVAYEQSFDTCFKEHEDLCQLWTVFTVNGETQKPQEFNLGPMAGAIMERFPDEVVAATSITKYQFANPLYYGNNRFNTFSNIGADSLFFETMGIEVVKGNPVQDLQQQDVIYLSESLAKQMFADEEPIGKVVNSNKSYDLTVKGIYKDIPDNSTLQPAAVVSLPTLLNRRSRGYSWNGGDSWPAYLRVKPGTDLEDLNVRIAKAIEEQHPSKDDSAITCMLKPIRDTYRNYEHVQLITQILTVLGVAILFITALNYVLISIASLSQRAKAVGIHKCSGAQTGTIFGMFLWETGIIIVFALLLMTFLVFNFQEFVEETASTKLTNLFAWQRIWVPACVTLVLFLVGGIMPGIIFSNIPVTQVFKKYTEGKKSWKRTLLFVQFAGVAFIGGLIVLISFQYNHVINKDVGYSPVRMAYGGHSLRNAEEYDINYSFYHSLPYVDAIATSHNNPIDGYSGEFIRDENGKELFSARYDYITKNYPELMGMTFKQGRSPSAREEVIVNETFVEKMNWGNNAIGKQIPYRNEKYTVVGVLDNFTIMNHKVAPMPLVFWYNTDKFGYYVQIRLKEPFAENLKRLNEDVSKAFPHKRVEFKSMEEEIRKAYDDIRILRNATMVACFVILFITLMGLTGYTNDETQRRSKEIAIRKVNGAEASGIIELLAKDVLWTALPAVLLGTLAAWYVGEIWVSQFATVVSNIVPVYILTALIILLTIVGVVVVKTWRIANENPVVSIKSE